MTDNYVDTDVDAHVDGPRPLSFPRCSSLESRHGKHRMARMEDGAYLCLNRRCGYESREALRDPGPVWIVWAMLAAAVVVLGYHAVKFLV